ncbi:MAG TPA: hypothetical protein VF546_16825 [Pyrinomonadaceae bacterium]|jgi:hypothetical protein
MKNKLTLLCLLVIALVSLGVSLTKSTAIKARFALLQGTAAPYTLDWYALEAQAQGAQQYQFSAGIYEYAQPDTWDDVLAGNSFIIAEPVEARGYAEADDRGIETWYRFRIIETLSTKPVHRPLGLPPSDLAPPQANEILLPRHGGTLVRNGVTLTAIDGQFPQFVTAPPQRYLLILDIDQTSKVGYVWLGPLGVYRLDSAGTMTSVVVDNPYITNKRPENNPYYQDIAERYNNSVNQLRAALQGSPAPTPTPCQSSSLAVRRCIQRGGSWDYSTCICEY